MNTQEINYYFDFFKKVVLEFSPKLFVAFTLLFGGLWLTSFITKTAKKLMHKRKVEITLTNFLGNILFWALRILLFIMVISKLGIDTSSFVAILGAAGLAVGLALQGSLSNFAGGILIILFKPFKVGDLIEVQGEQGKVDEILIFSTKIITNNNQTLYIPNGVLSNGKIKNYSQLPIRRTDIEIITTYNTNVSLLKKELESIISNQNLVLAEPNPEVFINNFTAENIHFIARVWTENSNFIKAKSEILEASQKLIE